MDTHVHVTMSRTSGEQRRGALDKYVHQHASTVNDASVCFDETERSFRKNHLLSNETVAASTEAGGSAATAAGTEEGGGGATAGAEEDGGSTEETAWMPKYRGDGMAVNTPTVSAPLRIHAKAWQEPWKRVKRPVRATEAELTANDAILQK